jgi:hypothetical protein
LDISVLGYIAIVEKKKNPSEVWHLPPGTSRISEDRNTVLADKTVPLS